MAVLSIPQLKSLWVNGFIPDENDYADLFDSINQFTRNPRIFLTVLDFQDNGDGTYTANLGFPISGFLYLNAIKPTSSTPTLTEKISIDVFEYASNNSGNVTIDADTSNNAQITFDFNPSADTSVFVGEYLVG